MTLHYANSELFRVVFNDVTEAIKDATEYLEGEMRDRVWGMSSSTVLSLYNAESIRLTNKLVAMSSWLLVHRAYFKGEIHTLIGSRLKDLPVLADMDDVLYNALPIEFLSFMMRVDMLYDRIKRLDDQINTPIHRPEYTGRPHLQIVG